MSALYQRVYDDIRNRIVRGDLKIGSRLPREAQLREHYSVSSITIRRALDMLREDGFITRQPRIGTTVVSNTPTRPREGQKEPLIGLIVTNFDEAFGAHILTGAFEASFGTANLIVKLTRGEAGRETEAIQSVIRAGVQGIILMPLISEMINPVVLKLIGEHFPLTILDRHYQTIPVAAVSSDHEAGAITATEYLFDAGHRHVAIIGAPRTVTSNADRHSGWVKAHALRHISLDQSLSYHEIRSTTPGTNVSVEDDQVQLHAFIEQHPEVTAFVACEYNIALILRDTLDDMGLRIPEDKSIICFDHRPAGFDHTLSHFTHMKQEQEELGRLAVETTIQQIREGASTEKISLPLTLVEGETVAHLND